MSAPPLLFGHGLWNVSLTARLKPQLTLREDGSSGLSWVLSAGIRVLGPQEGVVGHGIERS